MSARANCKLIGRWRIVQADIWERDHLDLCGPAMITITGHGRGEIAFGALQAGLDIEYSRSSVGFTWEGFDEMDEVSGDGFAATSPPCSRSWQRSTKSPPIAMRARPDALAPSEPPEPEPPAKSSSSSWLPSLHPLKSWSLQQTRRGSDWSMAPVVEAFQAMRGASFLVAVTFAAEVTVARRFDTPRQLMSFLGLVPTERSTGDTVRRKGLTLAGNRRALVEAGLDLSLSGANQRCRARLEGLPKPVRDIAWKAQVRLCVRYRRLRQEAPIVVAAIAREMAAFLSSGERSRHHKVKEDGLFLPLPRAGSGARKAGELPSLVM